MCTDKNLNYIRIHNINFLCFINNLYKIRVRSLRNYNVQPCICNFIHKLLCNLSLSFIVLLHLLLLYLLLPCCLFLWCTMIVELGLEVESYTLFDLFSS